MTQHYPKPSCEYYSSKTSHCLRQPTRRFVSIMRGYISLCVEKHLPEQNKCDQEMLEQEMEAILQEKGLSGTDSLQLLEDGLLGMP